jgi:hypothetical protein
MFGLISEGRSFVHMDWVDSKVARQSMFQFGYQNLFLPNRGFIVWLLTPEGRLVFGNVWLPADESLVRNPQKLQFVPQVFDAGPDILTIEESTCWAAGICMDLQPADSFSRILLSSFWPQFLV